MAININLLQGIQEVRRGDATILHLLFVDDALFFSKIIKNACKALNNIMSSLDSVGSISCQMLNSQ